MIKLFLLLLLSIPVVAQSQFIYTTNNGKITITGYTGPATAVVIPSQIHGLPVATIGDGAFSAFLGNSSPTNLTIPDSVTNIGYGVFDECFGLASISIGSGVQSIGTGTFVYCYNLDAISVNPTNPFYSSLRGILFNKNQTALIAFPDGITGGYIISNSVISIGDSAFSFCRSLTSVTIPNSVTSIGMQAFQNCSAFTTVTLGTNVTSLGYNAFYGCSSLTSITIPSSVINIGNGAFEACALHSVSIPNGVTSIGDFTFDICGSLTNIDIPNSVTSIGYGAFYSCGSLTSIIIPNSVTNIASDAFSHCFSLTNVYFTGNSPIPTNDASVFQYDSNATVYYLPGTTGWGQTFDSLPAFLWLPQIQTIGTKFGAEADQFGFNINWARGMVVIVETCTNFSNNLWQPISTKAVTDSSTSFSDPQWTNYPSRFYRLRSP